MNDYRFAVFEKVKDIFEGNAGFPGLMITPPDPFPDPEDNKGIVILTPNSQYNTPIMFVYDNPAPASSVIRFNAKTTRNNHVQNIPALYLTADSEEKVSPVEFGGRGDLNHQVSNLRIRFECILSVTQGPADPTNPDKVAHLSRQVYGFVHDVEEIITNFNVRPALNTYNENALQDIKMQEWALVQGTEASGQVIVVGILVARITLLKR